MGQENKNFFNNRIGMRPSRNISAMEELNRISAPTQPVQPQPVSTQSGGGKKKILIILAIIAVFAILTFVGVYFALNQKKGGSSTSSNVGIHDSAVREAMTQYSDDVIKLEDVFTDINKGMISGVVFEDESQKVLKKYIDSVNNFNDAIKDKTSVSEKVSEDFKVLKERLGKNITSYNDAYKIYDNYYNAIKTNNIALISEYLKNTDNNVKVAAESYTKYINGQKKLTGELVAIYNDRNLVKNIFSATISDAVSNNTMTELIINVRDGLGG